MKSIFGVIALFLCMITFNATAQEIADNSPIYNCRSIILKGCNKVLSPPALQAVNSGSAGFKPQELTNKKAAEQQAAIQEQLKQTMQEIEEIERKTAAKILLINEEHKRAKEVEDLKLTESALAKITEASQLGEVLRKIQEKQGTFWGSLNPMNETRAASLVARINTLHAEAALNLATKEKLIKAAADMNQATKERLNISTDNDSNAKLISMAFPERIAVCAKYQVRNGWSQSYKFQAIFRRGYELNQATRSMDYPSLDSYVVIFLDNDQASFIKMASPYLSDLASAGTSGVDQRGTTWEVSKTSFCY